MLTYTYDLPLVMASILIAILSAFTGLALTNGISELSNNKKKLSIGMAAIVLGGGIWSMHFVAFLALQLPVSIYYDPLWTLSSMLIAILMTCTSLLIIHFGSRNPRNTIISGCFLGYGIVTMHYIGILGIQGCLPVFDYTNQVFVVLIGPLTGILAIWAAYKQRARFNIILGATIFGLSVSLVHYLGLYLTNFAILPVEEPIVMALDNAELAFLVIISAFTICAAFLLTATTFLGPEGSIAQHVPQPDITVATPHSDGTHEDPHVNDVVDLENKIFPLSSSVQNAVRVPVEKDNQITFLTEEDIAAVQAEGHYTLLHTPTGRFFCSWSISVAQSKLPDNFIQTHRSFLVNIKHVQGFTRNKDNGKCLFDTISSLTSVPVSRSRINEVKSVLGI
ncbi:MHYT domain-containing protein [Pseudovibrio sp. POLY-S9]|uniref:MHYT domain-containing protein n=1 Tax=Pseudovibrio sp. POLY-S9 TaxID=1576596 RepID=UPI00070AD0B4|nr:MHYT domain-containing protein [Pseudovibrio sp. POLY-S9]